jgi:hypothetical protein
MTGDRILSVAAGLGAIAVLRLGDRRKVMYTQSKGDRILSMVAEVGAITLGDCGDGGAIAFPWLLCSSRILRFGWTVADVPQSDFYRQAGGNLCLSDRR